MHTILSVNLEALLRKHFLLKLEIRKMFTRTWLILLAQEDLAKKKNKKEELNILEKKYSTNIFADINNLGSLKINCCTIRIIKGASMIDRYKTV